MAVNNYTNINLQLTCEKTGNNHDDIIRRVFRIQCHRTRTHAHVHLYLGFIHLKNSEIHDRF